MAQGFVRTIPRKPIALVRVNGKSANAVAGDQKIAYDYDPKRNYRNEGAFTDGIPDVDERRDLDFSLLGEMSISAPIVQELIDYLGRPCNAAEVKLEKWRKKRDMIAKAKALTDEDLGNIKRLRRNGVKVRTIAMKYGVSESFITKTTPSTNSRFEQPTGRINTGPKNTITGTLAT